MKIINPNNRVIEGFRKVHGDTYDYSLVEYKNAHTKIKVLCEQHEALIQSKGFSKPLINRSGNFIYIKCEKN